MVRVARVPIAMQRLGIYSVGAIKESENALKSVSEVLGGVGRLVKVGGIKVIRGLSAPEAVEGHGAGELALESTTNC